MMLIVSDQAAGQPARHDTASFGIYTVESLVRSARIGDSIAGFNASAPVVHAMMERFTSRLLRPEIGEFRLRQVSLDHAPFVTVLRRRYVALTLVEAFALDSLARLMEEEYPDPLDRALDRAGSDRILAPVDAFRYYRREASMLDSREKLRRFEIKYGADAPTRNIAEVVLNYAAQWVPGFKSDADGWPSRSEVIASYVPTYLSIDSRPTAVTVAEAGLRIYIWREGWGGKPGGALRPAFVSFGAVVAGERDGALASPLKGSSRFGGFVGWGDAKLAVIGGRESRILVTRSTQILPWLF